MTNGENGLGLAAGERAVIVHADDVGMSEASVAAWEDLFDGGLLSSASVMVPCPWFRQAAAVARERPGIDLGVHLTLTAEWEGYRWGPLSTRRPASGLLDADGFFHSTRQAVHRQARPATVAREIAAQLHRALAAGIDVTHLDSHMFSLFHPDLLPRYVRLALDHGLPPVVTCTGGRPEPWYQEAGDASGPRLIRRLRSLGVPLVDHLVVPDLRGGAEAARRMLDDLEPGLTHLIVHPARDTPELRAMARDWPRRVAEHAVLRDPALRRYAEAAEIRIVDYRALRDALRARRGPGELCKLC
jgi:predicted glycoside hydrolase/deacetylase ChbG (UPF0249 family)